MTNSQDSKATILVVDDTEANIDVLVETLSDDYELSVATEGESALEIAQETAPALILLDIMMPGIDGYEVCRRLKAEERTKDIPVIFVTAMGEMTDEMKGFELGAVDYITKPISPSVVQARVRAHVGLRQKTMQLADLSKKLSKYLAPQVYVSIFRGEQDVVIESKRKKLSIYFSDIVNFTHTTEGMEAEDLSELLNIYLEEMANIALKHGGTIDKYIGDAILVFFGDPLSRGVKEDAMACTAMALEMREAMAGLQARWSQMGIREPFRIRSGVSTGFCTVGNFGSRSRMDYTIVGSQVNLASRLESSAEPDQILISHETWALVRDEVYCIKLRPVTVKGFDNPVDSYQVIDYLANMTETSNIFTVGYLSEVAREVSEDYPIADLLAEIDEYGPNDLIAVVVENAVPQGIVMGYHLLRATSDEIKRNLFLDRTIGSIMKSDIIIVEAETPLRQVALKAMERAGDGAYEPVIIVSDSAYSGVLSARALYRQAITEEGNLSDAEPVE